METMPHSVGLPITQPTPAGHAAAIAKFPRQFFQSNTCAQHIDNSIERLLITDTRSSTFWGRLDLRNQ